MQSIKPGTQLYGLKPEMLLCYTVAASIFGYFGYNCVTTSGVGRKHGDRSLHPVGYAMDLRSKHIQDRSMKNTVLDRLKQALPQCDILLEDVGGAQEHYHIEFDPKDDEQFQADKAVYKQTGEWP